jgi:hypothetical protein
MRHMDSQARITAIAGPARALYITHLIAHLQRDAQRGATWTRLADRLVAEDTGLSLDQVKRARLWWCEIGVVKSHHKGIPPTTEYDIRATLDAWHQWLAANQIAASNGAPAHNQLCASAQTLVRQRTNVSAPAHRPDLDHDDDDDARTHRQNAITQEIAQAESAARALGLDPAQIQEECNAYSPRYPDKYYLATLRQRIAAAQAPLQVPLPTGSASRPARGQTFRRRQVVYTEEQRAAAEERARQRLEAKRTFRRPQVHYTDEQRAAADARARAELEAEGYYERRNQ